MSQTAYQKRADEYYRMYYGQLEGVQIVKYLGTEESDWGDGFPKFLVKYPNGETHEVTVSRDEEGNGGGFLFLPFEPLMDEYDRAHKLNKYEVK